MIEEAGGEWREPNFAAERVADILADDVSHLFEGAFIAHNGRTKKEMMVWQDATTQGTVVMNKEEEFLAMLEYRTQALKEAPYEVCCVSVAL